MHLVRGPPCRGFAASLPRETISSGRCLRSPGRTLCLCARPRRRLCDWLLQFGGLLPAQPAAQACDSSFAGGESQRTEPGPRPEFFGCGRTPLLSPDSPSDSCRGPAPLGARRAASRPSDTTSAFAGFWLCGFRAEAFRDWARRTWTRWRIWLLPAPRAGNARFQAACVGNTAHCCTVRKRRAGRMVLSRFRFQEIPTSPAPVAVCLQVGKRARRFKFPLTPLL